MQLLLDTHTVLWFASGDKLIPKHTRDLIEDANNQCFVSIASLWEIAIKNSQNKLELELSFEELYTQLLENNLEILPITFQHLQTMMTLPYHHRDPFDRVIIAQAIAEGILIATKDEAFKSYPVRIQWD